MLIVQTVVYFWETYAHLILLKASHQASELQHGLVNSTLRRADSEIDAKPYGYACEHPQGYRSVGADVVLEVLEDGQKEDNRSIR